MSSMSPMSQVRKLLLLDDIVPAHWTGVSCSTWCREPVINTGVMELMLTRIQPSAVSISHVFKANRAVIVSVIWPPTFSVCPYEGTNPVKDGLNAHPTKLAIIALSEKVYVPLSIWLTQVRIATLQLSKQFLVRFVPGAWGDLRRRTDGANSTSSSTGHMGRSSLRRRWSCYSAWSRSWVGGSSWSGDSSSDRCQGICLRNARFRPGRKTWWRTKHTRWTRWGRSTCIRQTNKWSSGWPVYC